MPDDTAAGGAPPSANAVDALDSKQRMIATTAKLLQRQGYHATGLKQVVDEADAPRGSIYHHFPGGKDELAEQAIRVAATQLTHAIRGARRSADGPADLTRRLGRALGRWLIGSAFLEGCPVSTVTLEVAPRSPELTAACRDAYAEWVGLVTRDLVEHGVDEESARDLGTTVVAGIEGALLLARAEQSVDPLDRVTGQLASMLEHAVVDHRRREPPSSREDGSGAGVAAGHPR